MPLIRRPVAFDSVGFLPGFPAVSEFACNPWQTSRVAGSCPNPPVSLARENNTLPATEALRLAMLQDSNVAPTAYAMMLNKGVVSAGLSGLGQCSGAAGGCGCKDCGPDGMQGLDFASAVDWVKANALPLGIGAAVVWFLKKR